MSPFSWAWKLSGLLKYLACKTKESTGWSNKETKTVFKPRPRIIKIIVVIIIVVVMNNNNNNNNK